MGPQPRANHARHRGGPLYLSRQPSPSPANRGQPCRLPGRSGGCQSGGRCGQEEGSLQGDLICECRALVQGHPPPRHLCSHITDSWLDALPYQEDAAAGPSAEGCPATVGWLSPLREPRMCFSHAGLQVHDALPHARRALLVFHHGYAKSPAPQRNPALGKYSIAVSHGLLSWGDHLIVTGLRLSMFTPETHPALSASCPTLATTFCPAH